MCERKLNQVAPSKAQPARSSDGPPPQTRLTNHDLAMVSKAMMMQVPNVAALAVVDGQISTVLPTCRSTNGLKAHGVDVHLQNAGCVKLIARVPTKPCVHLRRPLRPRLPGVCVKTQDIAIAFPHEELRVFVDPEERVRAVLPFGPVTRVVAVKMCRPRRIFERHERAVALRRAERLVPARDPAAGVIELQKVRVVTVSHDVPRETRGHGMTMRQVRRKALELRAPERRLRVGAYADKAQHYTNEESNPSHDA